MDPNSIPPLCLTAILTTEAIIGIAVGGVGGILLIILVILLLCCVYFCARHGKQESESLCMRSHVVGRPN